MYYITFTKLGYLVFSQVQLNVALSLAQIQCNIRKDFSKNFARRILWKVSLRMFSKKFCDLSKNVQCNFTIT